MQNIFILLCGHRCTGYWLYMKSYNRPVEETEEREECDDEEEEAEVQLLAQLLVLLLPEPSPALQCNALK